MEQVSTRAIMIQVRSIISHRRRLSAAVVVRPRPSGAGAMSFLNLVSP